MSKLRKEKMSKAVENLERKINNNETIIKDLVSSFLIPNIERNKLQKKSEILIIFSKIDTFYSRIGGTTIH